MAAPGGQRPPPYGRYLPLRSPPSRQPNPYANDFMYMNYGNLESQHQETAFVADHGRAAFEAYLSNGTIPTTFSQQHFRTGAYLNLDNVSLRTIDVRTGTREVRAQPNEQAALLGNRSQRDQYWSQQLQFNMNNWRRGNLGVIQIDRDRRLWGVALRCEMSWEILRQNPNPPCISMIWDNDLGEFSLFCSQRGDGHFVLSEDSA